MVPSATAPAMQNKMKIWYLAASSGGSPDRICPVIIPGIAIRPAAIIALRIGMVPVRTERRTTSRDASRRVAPWARSSSTHPNIVPYDAFPTATGPIFLSVGNDRQFGRLCNELGVPGLADDERFASNADRVAHRDELRAALIEQLADKDGGKLCETLLASGIPAGPILDMPGILTHPHTLHREMVVERDGYRGTGVPVRFGRTPGEARTPPPVFGSDGQAVLLEAGYSEEEISNLRESGIVLSERRRAR